MEYKFLEEAVTKVIKCKDDIDDNEFMPLIETEVDVKRKEHEEHRTRLIMDIAASRLRGNIPFDDICDQFECYIRGFSATNNKEGDTDYESK